MLCNCALVCVSCLCYKFVFACYVMVCLCVCIRLSIFLAESSGEDSKQCLAKITLNDSITSLQ